MMSSTYLGTWVPWVDALPYTQVAQRPSGPAAQQPSGTQRHSGLLENLNDMGKALRLAGR